MHKTSAVPVALLGACLLLPACSREVTATPGPASVVTPGAPATTAAPTTAAATTAAPTTAAPATTPAPTTPAPKTPAPSAAPTVPASGLTITAAGVGPFAWAKRFTPTATHQAAWNATCGAWLAPDAKEPLVIAIPTEGSQQGEVMSLVVLAPGARTARNVAIGSPWADVAKAEPKGTKADGPASRGWAVTDGAVRLVYVSWDGGKTVGSIEVQDPNQPLEASVKRNPCA